MKTSAVETTKTGRSSKRARSRKAAVIESTEGAGAHRRMAKTTMTKMAMSSKTASVKVRGTSKATSIYTKTIAVDDSRAMRDERVVVVDYSAGAVPIESPMVPTPAEAGKQSNSKTEAESDARPVDEESRVRIPTGEDRDGRSINKPRIVLRYINHLRTRWLNNNRLSIVRNGFLTRASGCRPAEPAAAWFESPALRLVAD